MELRRWTPLTFLAPGRYVDTDPRWAEFDLRRWAEQEYEWIPDPWNGLRDFARRPAETVAAGRGDCEDFALVAISWAVANDHDGVGLGFCFEPRTPVPTHAIGFDDTRVYSSGRIVRKSPERWVEDADRYRRVLTRRVRARAGRGATRPAGIR